MSVGYKETPSDLRHRAWGNEGLEEPEVPYAVEEWTRGDDGNPPGHLWHNRWRTTHLNAFGAEHGPEGVFILRMTRDGPDRCAA